MAEGVVDQLGWKPGPIQMIKSGLRRDKDTHPDTPGSVGGAPQTGGPMTRPSALRASAHRSSFVHLHNHTEYSMLDGAAKITPMLAEAQQLEMPAIGMTDHGN